MAEMNMKVFLSLIFEHRVLYDSRHPSFRRIAPRERAWDLVAKQLNIDVDIIKRRWKNTKDSYQKHLRNLKAYRNWPWAQEMEPFRPFMNVDGGLRMEAKEDDQQDPFEEHEEEDHRIVDEEYKDDIEVEELKYGDVLRELDNKITSKKRPISYSDDPEIQESTRKRPTLQEEDGSELIFVGYARTISKFSPCRQALVKFKIAKLIYEQEILQIEENERNANGESVL